MIRTALFTLIIFASLVYGYVPEYQYAEVKISGTGDIEFLQSSGIDIDRTSFGRNGSLIDGKVTVYVTEAQFSMIQEKGYSVSLTPLVVRDKLSYRNNTSIGDSMLIWQNRYPSICKRIQIGTSVQSRPLWVLKITDNIDIEEAEPEVKFVSTMHGDEVTGMEMEMFFIENILKGYEADNDTMKFIVDNTELYVMPLMNPDGNANNTRYNANGYDLNRNFPEGTYYDADLVNATLLPEIQAMIDFTSQHDFILSTNYHGGALVANYLFDKDFGVPNYSYAACPDDPHVTWLAYNYSVRNTPMFNGSFTDGITNGCEWYTIDGGMQDWNYRYHNVIDITLEISNTKWPSYTYIPGFWADN
ncbi:MAG: M14 family zinc carboxypeptidase, partial [Candidatus Delongbacteria bacterium]